MISVIIPTLNRADLLFFALDSLARQSLDPSAFEVLVVDNGSTDRTAKIANGAASKLSNLRYFYEPEPGLHAGRHRGMLEARGDILVFADDDIEAQPTWLASIREAFGKADVALVGGNNLPMFLESPPKWLKRLWDRPIRGGGHALPFLSILELQGGVRSISPLYVWGCNFSIRKKVLLAAGGFHPDGMPKERIRFRGDGETHIARFVAESGMKCLFHPGASVYHKVTPERMTYDYFRQRGFNQGVSDSFTALRGEAVPQQAQRSLAYRTARWGWRKIRSIVSFVNSDSAMRRALNEYTAGHKDGYVFHQEAYQSDPEVREWVHRPKYF